MEQLKFPLAFDATAVELVATAPAPSGVAMNGFPMNGAPRAAAASAVAQFRPASALDAEREGAVVLRSWVDAGDMDAFLARILAWADRGESRYVCTTNVHSAVLADRDGDYREVINRADGNTPDGWPIAWAMRRLGHVNQIRVSGPDLMWKMAERASTARKQIYLYGATEEVLERLQERLEGAFPGLRIAGSYAPPFRPLTPAEDEAVVAAINASGASIVLVGLGCPKQERWMAEHRGRVHAVMVGVGAAFDFLSGRIRRAPPWMQRCGLEWLHRLCQEPRRLLKRYWTTNSRFVWRLAGVVMVFTLRARTEAAALRRTGVSAVPVLRVRTEVSDGVSADV